MDDDLQWLMHRSHARMHFGRRQLPRKDMRGSVLGCEARLVRQGDRHRNTGQWQLHLRPMRHSELRVSPLD